jgi:2-phosphoglycerate kinase
MNDINSTNFDIKIPECFIVFISGVPGTGKTTISYELLKKYNEFRIIEETDIIREVLRGYNEYIRDTFNDMASFIFDKLLIEDHMKLLTIDEAKQQCKHMKKSLEHIIARQKRKGIPSIINGVHIVPEILNGIFDNIDIIYINLFINNENKIHNRIANRDPQSYMLNEIPLIYKTNYDLYLSTEKLSQNTGFVFNNIDVTDLNISETLNVVINCIKARVDKKGG